MGFGGIYEAKGMANSRGKLFFRKREHGKDFAKVA
jgi:hypothetical protein